MKELIDKLADYVTESGQQIHALKESNKKLREEIHSLTRELEQIKQEKRDYEELLEERKVVQAKVEKVLGHINRLQIT